MLGQKSVYSKEAYNGNFIGVDFLEKQDFTGDLILNPQEFKNKVIPIFLSTHPEKTKIAASISVGFLWTMIKGIQIGDIVLCPDGSGNYHIAEVIDEYEYHKEKTLPHRRNVRWYPIKISRQEMSQPLKYSSGSIGTISNITKHSKEIESFIAGINPKILTSTDETIENTSEFALEEQLEEFLIENWASTELGKKYDIFQEDGELVGQQFNTDVGPIDILAISKDKKTLLVIELKRGRTSDIVIGQCLRYMGFVKNELAEENQNVLGMIIAHGEDIKIKHALTMTQNIEFFTYKVDFHLTKRY